MAHPIQATALKLLGDKNEFEKQARVDLTVAFLATAANDEMLDATRALIELAAALKKAGRAKAAMTLSVLVMSGAGALRKTAAALSTKRTERAESSAKQLSGTSNTPVSSGPPPKGAIKASPLARFTAVPKREDEQP